MRLSKSRILLAYLAIAYPGQSVSRTELADFLWGIDIGRASRMASLRQCVRDLRVTLSLGDKSALMADDRTVVLHIEHIFTDAGELLERRAAHILELVAERKSLADCVQRWSRRFLADEDGSGGFADDWVRDRRTELFQHLVGILEGALDDLVGAARWQDAQFIAELTLQVESWNESATRLLMRTTASTRGAAPALQLYDNLRAALREHIDSEPSRETSRLAEEIRTGGTLDVNSTREAVMVVDAIANISPGPSKLAVLPPDFHFGANQATDSLAHLWIGATEELRTKLANFRTFSVLSSSVSQFYSPRGDRIQALRDELGLRFVVETQVFSLGSAFRLKVDLIDTSEGVSLVHKSFDFHPDVLLDELEATLGPLAIRIDQLLTEYEIVRSTRKSTSDMDAFDWWARAQAQFHQWSSDSEAASERFLLAAIARDPGYGQAHSNLSRVFSARRLVRPGTQQEMSTLLSKAIQHGRESVRREPDHARCHVALGWGLIHARQFEEARVEFATAVSANPYDTDVVIAGSVASALIGEPLTDDNLTPMDLAERAISLCATNQPDYYRAYQAMALYLEGRPEESVEHLEAVIDSMPGTYGWLAAALQELGRETQAKEAAGALVAQATNHWSEGPRPTRDQVARWFWEVTPLNRPQDKERLARALSGAGLSLPI